MTSDDGSMATIEVTEQTANERALPYARPQTLLAVCSIAGLRDVNQDVATALQLARQSDDPVDVLALADGMGGEARGELAAECAVSGFLSRFLVGFLGGRGRTQSADVQRHMALAMHAGNENVVVAADMLQLTGMGTTLTTAVIVGCNLFVAHVGDSRCCLFRDGKLLQLTHDDSFVQTLVDQGYITREEADRHPRANELTRALGYPNDLDGLEVTAHKLHPGDGVLLSSDGLWKADADLAQRLHAGLHGKPFSQIVVDQLVYDLVCDALEAGSDDNISVALAWCAPEAPNSASAPINQEDDANHGD